MIFYESLNLCKKDLFLPPDRQLFSGEMAKTTLCLCSQLNLHRSRREHRQMLTLHFSLDSICTGSTFARLFCLPNMRITSHLFIYEGANQLHRDSGAAGSAADPHGQNLSTIQPYCTQRYRMSVQKYKYKYQGWVFAAACCSTTRIMAPDKLRLVFLLLACEIIVTRSVKRKGSKQIQWKRSFLCKWVCFYPSGPDPDKS